MCGNWGFGDVGLAYLVAAVVAALGDKPPPRPFWAGGSSGKKAIPRSGGQAEGMRFA